MRDIRSEGAIFVPFRAKPRKSTRRRSCGLKILFYSSFTGLFADSLPVLGLPEPVTMFAPKFTMFVGGKRGLVG